MFYGNIYTDDKTPRSSLKDMKETFHDKKKYIFKKNNLYWEEEKNWETKNWERSYGEIVLNAAYDVFGFW